MRYFIIKQTVDDTVKFLLKKQKQLAGIDNWSDIELIGDFSDSEEAVNYANERNMYPLSIDLGESNG